MEKSSVWYMGGTDGSGEYVVVASSDKGRVGYREIGDNKYRVRLEPASSDVFLLTKMRQSLGAAGWNPPNEEQLRFSVVVKGMDNLKKALSHALSLTVSKTDANPDAPVWAKNLIDNPVPYTNLVAKDGVVDDEDESEDEDSSDEEPVVVQHYQLDDLITAAEMLAQSLRDLRP